MSRGNKDNLKILSSDEARKYGSIGGKASAEARRKKKSMKEAASTILNLNVTEEMKKTLKEMGIEDEDLIMQTATLVSVLQKALKGDIRAVEFLRDTAGENPNSINIKIEKEVDPFTKSIYESIGKENVLDETETDT